MTYRYQKKYAEPIPTVKPSAVPSSSEGYRLVIATPVKDKQNQINLLIAVINLRYKLLLRHALCPAVLA